MAYHVHTITSLEQLKECEIFQIDQYQWTEGDKPKAYGRMGLLQDYGLIIMMTALEKDPICTYTMNDDPVYKDSCMEAFLNFSSDPSGKKYLNFEMNANGALLSAYGTAKDRKFLINHTSRRAICEAKLEEVSWQVILKIPMELICELYQIKPLQQGDSFTCNFYKLCETPGFEHYASYAPIRSEKPNFHLPEFFEKAVIS